VGVGASLKILVMEDGEMLCLKLEYSGREKAFIINVYE
jgi:hypothetical protein